MEDAERMHQGEPLLKRVFAYVPLHVREIALDIGKYMMVGLFFGAFLKAFIPADTVVGYLGREKGFLAILTALPISVVIEACSEGFAIIAGQLYVMGASLSVVFVMTMVGVTTDLTEMLVVWSRIGKRATVAHVLTGTVLTVLAATILLAFT